MSPRPGPVATSPYVIDYEGAFTFPIPPEVLWDHIEHVEGFGVRLSWLTEFRLEGESLRPGTVLYGVVSPPLPYQMRINVHIDRCEPPSRIEASVHGDLEGRARLLLVSRACGTEVRSAWSIEMMQRPMRIAARIAHPVLRWGHDRVVDMTVNGFRRHIVVDP